MGVDARLGVGEALCGEEVVDVVAVQEPLAELADDVGDVAVVPSRARLMPWSVRRRTRIHVLVLPGWWARTSCTSAIEAPYSCWRKMWGGSGQPPRGSNSPAAP